MIAERIISRRGTRSEDGVRLGMLLEKKRVMGCGLRMSADCCCCCWGGEESGREKEGGKIFIGDHAFISFGEGRVAWHFRGLYTYLFIFFFALVSPCVWPPICIPHAVFFHAPSFFHFFFSFFLATPFLFFTFFLHFFSSLFFFLFLFFGLLPVTCPLCMTSATRHNPIHSRPTYSNPIHSSPV